MDEINSQLRKEDYLNLKNISWVVLGVSKHTPWKSECLVKALTCSALIKKYNLPTIIFLGLNKENKGELSAHAWIKCGDVYIIGGDGTGYTVVGKFTTRIDEG